MAISFGTPGRPRKSIRDNKFELVQSSGAIRTPAKLANTVAAADVVDGKFVAINAQGDYEAAPDAKRSVRMIFTGDTQRMNAAYEPTDAFPDYNLPGNPPPDATSFVRPGIDPSDTVTGWMGDIEGIWPAALVDLSNVGNAIAGINLNDPVTVSGGRLKKADPAADEVIGYVTATAAVLGSAAIQASIRVR